MSTSTSSAIDSLSTSFAHPKMDQTLGIATALFIGMAILIAIVITCVLAAATSGFQRGGDALVYKVVYAISAGFGSLGLIPLAILVCKKGYQKMIAIQPVPEDPISDSEL